MKALLAVAAVSQFAFANEPNNNNNEPINNNNNNDPLPQGGEYVITVEEQGFAELDTVQSYMEVMVEKKGFGTLIASKAQTDAFKGLDVKEGEVVLSHGEGLGIGAIAADDTATPPVLAADATPAHFQDATTLSIAATSAMVEDASVKAAIKYFGSFKLVAKANVVFANGLTADANLNSSVVEISGGKKVAFKGAFSAAENSDSSFALKDVATELCVSGNGQIAPKLSMDQYTMITVSGGNADAPIQLPAIVCTVAQG